MYEVVVSLANIGITDAETEAGQELLLDEANHYTLRMQAARTLGKHLGNAFCPGNIAAQAR